MKRNTNSSSATLWLLAASLLALAGCSSTPTKVNTGAIPARTFSFVNLGLPPDYAENRAHIHALVQNAISRNLAAKGVARSASGPGDVTVAYLVILGNNATTSSIHDYFGYGEDATALVEKAHAAGTGSKNPNFFEAGTLVIDIIDSRNYKLLKRNYVTRSILRNPAVEVRQARMQEAVDEALKDLRIAF